MKKIAKIQINLFQSDTYRAMLAKYGAPGALLIVRLQVMEQADTLPDFSDERQLLILATEIGSDASTVAQMLVTLRQWQLPEVNSENSLDARPMRQSQQTENKSGQKQSPNNLKKPKNLTPAKQNQLHRRLARKDRRQTRQKLRSLKRLGLTAITP